MSTLFYLPADQQEYTWSSDTKALCLDELSRAAQRCRYHLIAPEPLPVWDGTPCVLLPIGIWQRLERALTALEALRL